MIRGTNAEFRFKLPYDFAEIPTIKITFWQDNNDGPSSDKPLPLVKVREQCRGIQGQPNMCRVILNQEETLRFTEKRKAKVQLRGLTATGVPIASQQQLITVYPIQDDAVLDDDIILPAPTYDELVLLDGQRIIQGG